MWFTSNRVVDIAWALVSSDRRTFWFALAVAGGMGFVAAELAWRVIR